MTVVPVKEYGAEEIKEIADSNGFGCEIFRDYGGNDRVALLN